jgi:hypothetical protein
MPVVLPGGVEFEGQREGFHGRQGDDGVQQPAALFLLASHALYAVGQGHETYGSMTDIIAAVR